jgi:RNA polymerase sigma-70 factor, ECF subfamily
MRLRERDGEPLFLWRRNDRLVDLPIPNFRPRPQEDSDEHLASRARRGDRRAFDCLVHRHERALRGYVALRVGSETVDDVMQEIWTGCWLALPQFARRSRFKVWLYGIAANKCTDQLRSSTRRASSSLDELGQIPDLRRPYEQVEERDAVFAALEKLPDAQREVMELYYYGELTLPEIASALNRNLNTVKYQFYRAHDTVARVLRPRT